MELNKLKTIYIFTDWYVPGFKAGGPIQSVYNLATLLSKHFLVRIIARNTDYGNSVPYQGIVPNEWTTLAPGHEVMYLSAENTGFGTIRKLCRTAKGDIILINGIFSFYFSILPLFLANYYNVQKAFVVVRGMLHQSALAVKPVKKQLFLAFARGFGLYKKVTLLSTSGYENEEIRKSLGKVSISTSPNIPLPPKDSSSLKDKKFKDESNRLRLLFLGRISPEKNPVAVIKALAGIDYPVSVTFIGSSINLAYQDVFQNKIKNLPANIQMKWIEELPHLQIQELFDQIDVMILPSHGENFGHAIFESFAHGTPVIIGNNTPWKGIEEDKAGLEVDADAIEDITKAINIFNNMQAEEYRSWQIGSLEMANRYYRDNNFKKHYLTLLS